MKLSLKDSSILIVCVLLCNACIPKCPSATTTITIDSTLQSVVQHHVSEATLRIQAEWGMGVLWNMQNASVCAMYCTDTMVNYTYEPLEMGTIMQPFTILAALSSDNISYNVVDTALAIQDIIASSNTNATHTLASQVYANNPIKVIEFLQDIGGNIEVDTPAIKSINDISTIYYGYHYRITPIHLMSLYANLVKNQLQCDTLAQQLIYQGLHDVVWNNELGTASVNPWGGRKAQSDIVSIAGKTGAAQIYKEGKYHDKRHRISFVGYFPKDNPHYICLIILNEPQFPYDAGTDCGGCVRKIAEEIYSETTIKCN